MRTQTEKRFCSITRESCEKLARELYAQDHPDDGPFFLGFTDHWDEYFNRVYAFDEAMRALGFTLVRSA